MVFSSTIFLFVFLPVTILIYYNPFFKSRRFRNIFLLIASLLFYAWGEPVNVLLMLFSIVLGWYTGLRIEKEDEGRARKRWLTGGVSVVVIIFFIFKYLTFVTDQICLFLSTSNDHIRISLPIGISFFLFQIMSYMFDIYYGNAGAQKSILDVGLYISLFPQLIAGPIVRYSVIEDQIHNRTETKELFSSGMIRFVFGLGKKVLIANNLGIVADSIFGIESTVPVLTAWLGAIAYTLQIYFDFSGYSDMAIGLGSLFGFAFPENFDHPYIATSVTDFWRRWHISLSTWFRDYVYIPLGGSRVDKGRVFRNLFIVWLLTGIWHGANWTFLLWGMLYFVILIFEKNVLSHIKNMPGLIGHIYTLLTVCIAWVIFRSDSIAAAWKMISNMFCSYGSGLWDRESMYFLDSCKWVLMAGIVFSTPFPAKAAEYLRKKGMVMPVIGFNILIFLVSLISVISSAYNPFLYFNF